MTIENLTVVQKRMAEYTALLSEIKGRLGIVHSVLTGKLTNIVPDKGAEEICYLELRMICELIALGSLVVHGDIANAKTGKIRTHWEADWILKRLARIHGDFYPRPTQQLVIKPGTTKRVSKPVPITSGYLTQVELIRLYHECGTYLHRGTLDDMLAKGSRPVDFNKIKAWLGKIVTLLSYHQILVANSKREYWVVMHNGDKDEIFYAVARMP
jgi:hypothetical protein